MELKYKKKAIPHSIRQRIARDNGASIGVDAIANCVYCGKQGKIFWPKSSTGRGGMWVQFSDLELDHIHPESKGGETVYENIQLLCRRCNRRKGSKL
jgi:5-methylcytosine-specific restriction endonuclease McrA